MQLSAPANDESFSSQRARSVPVPSSMSTVRGYPSKLKIFRIPGSRFYQVRCYMDGRMYMRSTRSEEKYQAIDFAKRFYDELLLSCRNTTSEGLNARNRMERTPRPELLPTLQFSKVANRTIEAERGRMMRGELAMQSFRSLRNRLQKQIYPALGNLDIRAVTHHDLQKLVDGLVKRKASSVTIAQYLQAVRLVFKHAEIEQLIDRIPPFPKLRLSSQPRGGVHRKRVSGIATYCKTPRTST